MVIFVLVGSLLGLFLIHVVYRSGVLSLLYDAKIGETGIDVVALSLVKLFTLPYSEIQKVKLVGVRGQFTLTAINLSNRTLINAFLIERKSGSSGPAILVTPACVSKFKRVLADNGIECT